MAIAFVLIGWAFFAAVFSGVGLGVARLLRDRETSVFWLGWCAATALLQAWCLVLPIDDRALGLVGVLSAAGWWLGWRDVSRRARTGWAAAVPLAPVAVWLADRALQAPQNGDSRLYHLSAVRWAETFPVVPGLGNLHVRLGFNNSSTLYQALLDRGPGRGHGTHLAASLLVLALLARGLPAIAGLLRGRPVTARAMVDVVLLAAAVDLAFGPNLSSASPDLPAYVLGAAVASELTGWIEAGATGPVTGLALLAATLVSVKLSALGLAAGVLLVVALRRRLSVAALLVSLAVLVPWVARGIVLSGYPLFPATVGGLAVDWRVPDATALAEARYIRAWGRRPGAPVEQVLASWRWLWPWLRSLSFLNREVVVPLAVGIAAGLAAIRRGAGALWLLAIPPTAEILWWFFTSPDVRFAGASFWLAAAVGLALAGARRTGRAAVAFGAGALLLAAWPVAEARSIGWIADYRFRDAPLGKAAAFRTASGLMLTVPRGSEECGSMLLCTPAPNAALRMRDPARIQAGFATRSAQDSTIQSRTSKLPP